MLRQDEQTHLLEYADGQDLTVLVKNGQDEEATLIIADVLNQLHAPSMSPMPTELMPLKIWLRDLFKKAEEDRRTGIHSIYMRAASTADSLFAEPYDICVLHGDIHHENIRHSSQRGWLAFDPKGLIGERTYDAANTLCNPVDMPELVENEVRLMKNAEILAQKLMIDRTRILDFVFVYVCLSASWRLYDGQDPVHDLRIAEIVEPYIGV